MTTTPTPLQTILSATRYPFAVAQVVEGKIARTLSYQTTLEQCHVETSGWLAWNGSRITYIMAEQRIQGGKSYWCAV